MPKKIGLIFTIAGTVLILAALSIFLYNKKKDEDAGQNSQVLLSDVQQVIEERKADGPSASEPLTDDDDSQPSKVNESLSESDKVALVDGYECIGYLSIPDLDLNLPILSEWDYDRLDVAPCRQFGSVDTNDLVIAGHNYENHFGRLKLLELERSSSLQTWMGSNINTGRWSSISWPLRKCQESKTAVMIWFYIPARWEVKQELPCF